MSPIPSPGKDEDQDKFTARCMSDDVMKKEYSDNKQRLAICFGSFRKARGGKPPGENLNLDEKGRIIVAENVPILFNCQIEEKK